MDCWFCNNGTELIWGGDNDFEDYGLEGDGIVANLSCPKCNSFILAHSGDFIGTGEKDAKQKS